MNTSKKYDLIVLIGRFSPFHNGHKDLVEKAYQQSDNVLVLVGSADRALNIKNPWTFIERARMIQSSIPEDADKLLLVEPIYDYGTNAQWVENVGKAIKNTCLQEGIGDNIAMIGHDKDHTSFYLNFFKQWDYIEAPAFPKDWEVISATKIRQLWFERQFKYAESVLPVPVYNLLTDQFVFGEKSNIFHEYADVKEYKESWAGAPYEPIFVTVDAVTVQSGHVLLIKRRNNPGRGLWALPGGFLDPKERIKDAMIRELREETQLKVPEKVLRGNIKAREVFDDPSRSLRGRTITHAFLIALDDSEKLPKVKGSDDADEALWVPFADLEEKRSQIFEDHYLIIQSMLGKYITEEI